MTCTLAYVLGLRVEAGSYGSTHSVVACLPRDADRYTWLREGCQAHLPTL